MAYESLELLQQLGGDVDLTGNAMARAQVAGFLEDATAEREAEARRASYEQRAETMALLDRQMGGPLGEMRRHQGDVVDLSGRVAELREQLGKAEAKLERARSNYTFWAERAQLAEETVNRTAAPDPLEAAQMRAADALRQAHENRDILERAKRNLRQRSGSRSAHVRSEPTAVLTAAGESGGLRVRGGGYVTGWAE